MIRDLGLIRYIKYRNTLRKLPAAHRSTLLKIIKIYKQLDREIGRFKDSTGLNCPSGCGQCCESTKVESTILEALPLAVELYRLKGIGQWNGNFLSPLSEGRCIFYRADERIPGKGRCTVYAFRPLLCRLFGFSAFQDKYQRLLLYACARIKKMDMQRFQKAQSAIDQGQHIPKMSDYSMRVFNLDPYLGKERFLITEAVSKAFDRVEFLFEYVRRNRGYFLGLKISQDPIGLKV